MSRVISVRLTDDEDTDVRAGAAMARLSVSDFIKTHLWEDKKLAKEMEMIFYQLLQIETLIKGIPIAQTTVQPTADFANRETLFGKLKARGIPSSTVRQVEMVLDEMEATTSPEAMDNNVTAHFSDLRGS